MNMVDLNLGRNFFGDGLNEDTRTRLLALLDEPTEAHWDDAYSIILNDGGMTLWQAVLVVDPDFANADAPLSRFDDITGKSQRVSGWSRIPSLETIEQAIRYATH